MVDVGILELRRDGFGGAAGPGDEYGLARGVGIGKQATTRRSRGEISRCRIEIGDGAERALAGLRPQRERNGVAGLVPLIPGDRADEDAEGPANGGLAVTHRIQRKAQAGRKVGVFRGDDAAGDARIPREQQSLGGERRHCGLLSGNEGFCPVVSIDGRRIEVPTDSGVERKPRRRAEVVLHKTRHVPCAQVGCVGRVLLHRGGLPGHPIRSDIACGGGRGGGEADTGKVQQVGKEHGLVESKLTAHVEGMPASDPGNHVAQLIVVRAGDRSRIGCGRGEVGLGDAGQRGRPLDDKVGAVGREGLRRGASKGMNVAQVPIDSGCADLIDRPGDVATRGVADHVLRIEERGGHMVLCEYLVILAQIFVFRNRDGK